MSGTYRQDMPPPGGYKQIPFERIAAKQVLRPRTVIAGLIVTTSIGIYSWRQNYFKTTRLQTEMRGARLALHPMLHAEKDRNYLRQLRKNRDEEEQLMANVPGWVVGTLFGDTMYKSRSPDEWIDITEQEVYVHADPWYQRHKTQYHKWA